MATPRAVGVRLALPSDDWWELPLDPATRRRDIVRIVDTALAQRPDLAPTRPELIRILQQAAAQAAEAGAVYAASWVLIQDGRALQASVAVLVVAAEGSTPGRPPASVEEMAATLSPEDGASEVTTVELPLVGTAVRVRSRGPVTVPPLPAPTEMLCVQYVARVPTSPLTAFLTCTSPSLAYEEPLVEMFDALATTFGFTDAAGRWVTEGLVRS